MTPTVSPVARVLRTITQALTALGAVVAPAVALLDHLGHQVDGVWLAALIVLAIAAVTALHNALEHTGLIRTIGAQADATVAPPASDTPYSGLLHRTGRRTRPDQEA